jgi:hypothetical protein
MENVDAHVVYLCCLAQLSVWGLGFVLAAWVVRVFVKENKGD